MTDEPTPDDNHEPFERITFDNDKCHDPMPTDELPDEDPGCDHPAGKPPSAIDEDGEQTDSAGSFGRRGFLKKAAVGIFAGTTGVAATDQASANPVDRHINVFGVRATSYEIYMGGYNNTIYKGDEAGPNDRINSDFDMVDGYVGYQNRDTYWHDGNIHFLRADGMISFYFNPGWEPAYHNEIIVWGEGSGHHEYYLEVDGELELGSQANPKNDHDNGNWVFGNVWDYNRDTYTHTGPVTQVHIDGQVRVLLI